MALNRFGDRLKPSVNQSSTNHHSPAHGSLTYQLKNLTNGPAKVCQALGIRRKENGVDLTSNEIYLLNTPRVSGSKIGASERIGITAGKDKKWRFYIKGNVWVSRQRGVTI